MSEGAQVAAELQEPGSGLARFDVPVELVLTQLVIGEQMPHPGRASRGPAHQAPRRPAGFLVLGTYRCRGWAAGSVGRTDPCRRSPRCVYSSPRSSDPSVPSTFQAFKRGERQVIAAGPSLSDPLTRGAVARCTSTGGHLCTLDTGSRTHRR